MYLLMHLVFVLIDALVFVLVDELVFVLIDELVSSFSTCQCAVLSYFLVEALVCVPAEQHFQLSSANFRLQKSSSQFCDFVLKSFFLA